MCSQLVLAGTKTQFAKEAQFYAAALGDADTGLPPVSAALRPYLSQHPSVVIDADQMPFDIEPILDDGEHRRIQELEAEIDVLWRFVVPPTAREVFENFLTQVAAHRVSLCGAVGTGAVFG